MNPTSKADPQTEAITITASWEYWWQLADDVRQGAGALADTLDQIEREIFADPAALVTNFNHVGIAMLRETVAARRKRADQLEALADVGELEETK